MLSSTSPTPAMAPVTFVPSAPLRVSSCVVLGTRRRALTTTKPANAATPRRVARRKSSVNCTFSQPPTSKSSSNDDDLNESISKIRTLRGDLEKAIEAQDFSTAAKIRDSIQEIEKNASSQSSFSIVLANDEFYNAYRKGDADHMASVWLNTDTVSCTHALTGIVTGFDDVVQSWRKIFAIGKPTSLEIEILSIEICRNLAWIVCKQFISSVRGGQVIGGERIATNLFQKSHGKWLIVHHHASPVVVDDVERNDDDSKDNNSKENKGN